MQKLWVGQKTSLAHFVWAVRARVPEWVIRGSKISLRNHLGSISVAIAGVYIDPGNLITGRLEFRLMLTSIVALVGNATRHPVYLKQIPEDVEAWLVVGAVVTASVLVSIVVWSVLKVLGLDYWSHWSDGDVVPLDNPDGATKEQPDRAHDSTL